MAKTSGENNESESMSLLQSEYPRDDFCASAFGDAAGLAANPRAVILTWSGEKRSNRKRKEQVSQEVHCNACCFCFGTNKSESNC